MQASRKISVGKITPALQQNHDCYIVDAEGNAWQLILFMGLDHRRRLMGRVFHCWLLFHPNGGYRVHLISANVTAYLDSLTEEDSY